MQRIILLFFFLSGCSALVYEVAWVRQLSLTLGSTAQATSTVLAVFLGGLAIGAALGGKLADRQRHDALTLYGMLEIGAGVTGLLATLLLNAAPSVYVWLYHALSPQTLPIIRILLAAGILVAPTMIMGATLPVLVRYLHQYRLSGELFSSLYAVNTLGAAVGSLAACFLGFSYIGLQATIYCAAAVNVAIGALAILISRRPQPAPVDSFPEQAPAQLPGATKQTSAVPLKILCIIAFFTGYTALSYEVLWVRILRTYLTSLTYAFTIVVTMFLLGLAVGSYLINRRRLLKWDALSTRPYLLFGILQYIAAAGGALSVQMIQSSSTLYPALKEHLFSPLGLVPFPLADHLVFMIVVSFFSVFLPAVFIGMSFPLIGTLAASREKGPATSVGLVYALNTAGCVLGSLICGLVLMPTIGSYVALGWTAGLSALIGLLACLYAERVPRKMKIAMLIIPVAIVAKCSMMPVGLICPPGAKLLATGEDTTGIMEVVAVPKDEEVQLILNGNCLAASSPISRRYMRTLASLPLLLHKRPANVLVGCFGTGTTSGAVALDPAVDKVDVVELSPMVLDAAHFFKDSNYDVLRNTKVHVHINDVRNFLLTTSQRYDVVTFEPPPPTEAGVVNLYSQEFYELLDQHLTDGGIVCQWIPMHQVSGSLWKMMIATAHSVFPYVSVWLPDRKEAILLASNRPLDVDVAGMQARIDRSPALKSALTDVGLESPMAVLSTFIASGAALDAYTADSLPITDDLPRLEFFIPFVGPLLKQPQVEAMGLPDLRRFVADNAGSKGFTTPEFWAQWEPNHLLRGIDQTHTKGKADQLIDKAFSLVPHSSWLQYVDSHRRRYYPSKDDSWMHGG